MNYTETVLKYIEYGYKCLPTGPIKAPAVPAGCDWKNDLPIEMFENCHGIGLKMGEQSGFIECIDIDNHAGNAKDKLIKYLEIPEVKEIYENHKIPLESTMNGGFHLLYKCDSMQGSRKLAQQLIDGKQDCFIETKGLASYVCVWPTPGYKIIRNSIFEIPKLTGIERAILIDNAISMNEFFPAQKTEYEQTDRPGDLYNASMSAISDMKSSLQGLGWQDVGGNRWRRPGKKEGISATLGKVAPNVFYVFTGNAYPFEQMKAYTPFQVLGLVKYNGDFKEAAKSIAPERVPIHNSKPQLETTEIEKLLTGARIDTRKHIEKPPTILSVKEQNGTQIQFNRVFTLGNFSCIIGKAKSKKTFFISLVTAALLSNDDRGKFKGDLPTAKNEILYFDTEQGDYDSYNVIRRIELMAGCGMRFRAYNIREYGPLERCQIIEYAFKLFGDKTGYCVIDGIADLATGINDEEEATRVVTVLLRLSKVYNCHISTIIHQNKNDGFATGHLGSSIMKKSEIIISVTKNDSDSSIVKCDMSRGISFEDFIMTISPEGIPEIIGEAKQRPAAVVSFYDKEDPAIEEKEVMQPNADFYAENDVDKLKW